ncbi:Similar to Mitochondrial inner membrane i-AAA protease supercomplex subunit YME1; acc. no. P32795 [Pyronema omphalodes CBS 100304]|uniref:Similar to Mitochondrial inner membrane i-AAA protease supercomplex subunit YME1 acc. no. P32795 n=1 Tax=Pyronema omphalodes (strain CBS 100304) TaxID=1076935 RepID=U4KWB4_PYROM|nr:Similar to Mitochondrial inner membrane i-AAA protease supercomplex subunit YME1; acc. no. P32795 [Pyronema omphalodes CBS 100304]
MPAARTMASLIFTTGSRQTTIPNFTKPTVFGHATQIGFHGPFFSAPTLAAGFRKPVTGLVSKGFSTLPPFSLNVIKPAPKHPQQGQIRSMMSFGGPSQSTLYRAEQVANNSPQNAYAQERFYELLLRAGLPQVVAERHQSGLYATNKGCEEKYAQALEKLSVAEDSSISMDGTSAYGGARSGFGNDKIQAIGQAVAARSRGANVSINHGKSQGSTGGREDPIYVVVDESIGGSIFKWIKFLFYFGLFGYICLVFLSLAVEFTGVLKSTRGPANNEASASQQTARFSDVHGCDEAKEELQELVDFLKDPKSFSTLGGKLPKGVLLVGPPGTGKTLLARAVAGEAGVPFFFMSGSEFDEVYVGVGAKRVRELFAQARAKAPAIVFIDELDAIGGKRNERDAAYVKQTLNQLLVDLDGFSQNSGVIFLAATNFPQMLDKALTRPGRFDRSITVPLPDVRGRIQIIKHHMKNIQAADSVDPSLLARGTPGFSGAALENMVNQAAVRASRLKASDVKMEHFDWAKDKIMMGAERRSAVIPLKERIMTAYHEGGHTLVGLFTEGHTPVYKVTIMPRGQALGITHYLPEGDQLSITKKQCLAQIDAALGGKIAEEIVYGPDNVTGGCASDLSAATRVARMMVMRLGMSDALGNVDLSDDYRDLSSGTKELIEDEVRRIIKESHDRATKLIMSKRKELDLIAQALVEYETLSADEIQKVLKGEKLPHKIDSSSEKPLKLPEAVYSGPTLEGGPGNTGEVSASEK